MSTTPSPLLQLPNTYRAFYGSFTALRAFQHEVIAPLLQGQDLILQASTGSGKTEAVLAPCLERVIVSGRTQTVLYVVPTRALVHDLRRRLELLLHERLGLSLGIRTGDVKRLPAGQADLLLTTPESLDVMLGSSNREMRAFLQRTTTLIVDEVHQLVQGYRGRHLAYLIRRLEQRRRQPLQKIALSATLGDPEAIRTGLGFHKEAVWVSQAVQRQIQPHLVHLKREPDELVAFIDDLAQRFGARKLLLFANSRSRCDQLFGWLRQRGYFQSATYLHYSNLKPRQRQEVERQFQRRSQALCIATSTLELGIDVGDIDGVILYEPPESVTTFLQRLGRANRQSQTTTFWGICRGQRAEAQLLQFLALYTLAQEGVMEATQAADLPSVLVQQILSTLYEHKQVSLPLLQTLFPQQAERLDTLVPALETRQWLRQRESNGLSASWRGGWRYARALRAHQIWSNFPDPEEPYTLEVEAQAVADLPWSIVRQLELGDQMELVGRCLQILDIQDGDRKVVRAKPVETPDAKALYWVGTGPPVSWEVAQTVQRLLQPGYRPDQQLTQGLFSRTRALLQEAQRRAERRVILHNGIELSRTPEGFYRYATYLGSVGNFILQRSIEEVYTARLPDFSCTADAMAVTCSDRIDLRNLPLPTTPDATRQWTGRHLRAVKALFAFNAFSRALPLALMIDEATNLLWDTRLAQTFTRYRQQSSSIAEGDPQHLEWDDASTAELEPQTAATWLRQGPQPPLLLQEKTRLGLTANTEPALPAVPAMHRAPRALTGTMVGNYIQHEQCDRLLSFDLLPYDQQPPKRTLVDRALGAARAAQGQDFETGVLDWLEQQGATLYRIPEQDATGKRLSMQERQARSVQVLTQLVQSASAGPHAVGHGHASLLGILAQPVLMQSDLGLNCTINDQVSIPSDPTAGCKPAATDPVTNCGAQHLAGTAMPVDGIGIPDLIEVTVQDGVVWLTIADIKDSVAPRYSQKWQVAFYAALLQKCLPRYEATRQVRLAEHGVLLTRPEPQTSSPARHVFALAPYLEAFALLQQRVEQLLCMPIADAPWQLQAHCASCAYVDTCYRQSLSTDDVMLLPHLTPGEYLKLQTAGHRTLSQAADWAQKGPTDVALSVDAQQAVRLAAKIRALTDNRVALLSDTTSQFPANLSSVLFVYLVHDPSSGKPRAWGLRRLTTPAASETLQTWIAATDADLATCHRAFCAHLRHWWQEGMTTDHGPHLVTFGMGTWRALQAAMRDAEDPTALDFLWHSEMPQHTDLRQLLVQHFALPIPLRVILASVARVWGLRPQIALPPYLLQDEDDGMAELLIHHRLKFLDISSPTESSRGNGDKISDPVLSPEQVTQLQQYLQAHLDLQQQLWQLCTSYVRSDRKQPSWTVNGPDPEPTLERDCVTFQERQQQWREQDILTIQQLPLAERVARYRALGPLLFEETTLDAEGRFVAHFRLPAEDPSTRFRPGDFLKLNPLGSPDLQTGAGVILAQYEPHAQHLAVIARQGRPLLTPRLRYTLDEDVEDWTTPRVVHAVREALTPGKHPQITGLLHGTLQRQAPAGGLSWAQHCLRHLSLNSRQRDALLLPFRHSVGLIEGPPGTGKTHLLACMLIALILEAAEAGRPMRIVVSALTHRAIDNVLLKVQQLLQEAVGQPFPGRCLKWGRRLSLDDDTDASALTYVDRAEDVTLAPYLILGATGFGLYQLFDSQAGNFPAFFDWVIFDEASQVVLPQALLSLIYGKGQYVFCGDVQQLPPVIRGPQATDGESMPDRSILAHLLNTYDDSVRVRLNETYRLNRELCELPSRLWYQGDFYPAPANAETRLRLPAYRNRELADAVLDPQRPATLVLVDHETDHQQSAAEVDLIARLAARLLLDYEVDAERLAILAPHRAQNNAIGRRLAELLAPHHTGDSLTLPLIDTVERLQGAERDVVLFSLTTSDPDHLENPFLNNPNRFNVAITRARHKLVVVGSRAFFTRVPRTEAGLLAHRCFTAYYHQCRDHKALFELWKCARE